MFPSFLFSSFIGGLETSFSSQVERCLQRPVSDPQASNLDGQRWRLGAYGSTGSTGML